MAEIKTRFGTLNLDSGGGGGVPLIVQINKDEGQLSQAQVITTLSSDNADPTQTVLKAGAKSLIAIIDAITDKDKNHVSLNTAGKLEVNSLDVTKLEQENWLILDSKDANELFTATVEKK